MSVSPSDTQSKTVSEITWPVVVPNERHHRHEMTHEVPPATVSRPASRRGIISPAFFLQCGVVVAACFWVAFIVTGGIVSSQQPADAGEKADVRQIQPEKVRPSAPAKRGTTPPKKVIVLPDAPAAGTSAPASARPTPSETAPADASPTDEATSTPPSATPPSQPQAPATTPPTQAPSAPAESSTPAPTPEQPSEVPSSPAAHAPVAPEGDTVAP